MNIIVLHGDNTKKSYERFRKFVDVGKKRGWEVARIDPKNSFSEQIVSVGLFEKERLMILENINLLSKKDFEWLKRKTNDLSGTLIIYHRTFIPKRTINQLPKNHKAEEFTLPKLIWKLLDSFYPSNARSILKLLHSVVETENIEFVFALISRQLRDLYWVKVGEETLDLPSWRKSKLKSQSDKFSEKLLKELISDFAKIDVKVKTSKANLLDELDYLIATKLE